MFIFFQIDLETRKMKLYHAQSTDLMNRSLYNRKWQLSFQKKKFLPKQNELQSTKYSNIPQIPFC